MTPINYIKVFFAALVIFLCFCSLILRVILCSVILGATRASVWISSILPLDLPFVSIRYATLRQVGTLYNTLIGGCPRSSSLSSFLLRSFALLIFSTALCSSRMILCDLCSLMGMVALLSFSCLAVLCGGCYILSTCFSFVFLIFHYISIFFRYVCWFACKFVY